MSIEHVLFDLDGTLTDPAQGITNSIIHSLKHFNIEVKDRTELYSCIGPPLIECYMKMWNFSLEEAKKALEVYREYFSVKGLFENEVYDGIEDMLKSLCASGKKLYLATSKPEVYARRILEHFNLDRYFTFIAGNSLTEDRSKKSDVIKYLFASCPQLEKDNAIMVGDREYDVLGARECSLDCVGVLYGYGSREEIEKAEAKYICESVTDLENLLLTL